MGIIRIEKTGNYSIISNMPLNDPRLSFKAKGLIAYLLSKPNDWKVIIEHLINESTDGKTAVYSAIRELEKYGYIKKEYSRSEGKINGINYTVYESPITGNLHSENLKQENEPLLITDNILITDNTNCSEVENPPSEPKNVSDKQQDNKPERIRAGVIPCIGGEEIIYKDEIERWSSVYPACDIVTEIKQAKEWLYNHPKKIKTRQGVRRYLTGWFARSQDKGGTKK